MRLGLWATVLAIVALAVPFGPGGHRARADSNPVVVLAFAPAIYPLSQASMPVYLPTWLPSIPRNTRTIASVATAPSKTDPQSVQASYQVSLTLPGRARCAHCDLITVVGANGPLGHAANAQRLPLFGTVFVYFWTNPQGSWMSWRIGRDFYRLRCSLPSLSGPGTTPCTISTYKRVVMSVVRVN